MNESVRKSIEAQIGHEFGAAHAYLSRAAYFEGQNLTGMASWMRAQSQEEVTHAMKFFEFLLDRGATPELPGIPKPPHGFTSPVHAFTTALEHEQKVTRPIYDLYELALAEKDYPAQILLQWFVTEQTEEEKSTNGIVDRLKMVEGSRSALLILDNELGVRTGDAHGV
ncbi:MAG: ferritin [Thermoleophilia bacterium]|nr:ferritin [Thermoleophilia bacterium]